MPLATIMAMEVEEEEGATTDRAALPLPINPLQLPM
jgi:hypothetical protein